MLISTFQTRDGDWIACAEYDGRGVYVRGIVDIDAIRTARACVLGGLFNTVASKVEAGSLVTSGARMRAGWRK